MRVAISAESPDINGFVSPRFGRCAGFIIAEIDNGTIRSSEFIANPGINAFRGAGIQAAQLVLSKNVQAVISGNLGPNAFAILNQAGVKVYLAFGLSIREAVKKLEAGALPELREASQGIRGGFGMRRRRGFGGALY